MSTVVAPAPGQARRRRRRRSRRESVPLLAIALAVVAVAFFALPLVALVVRAPWGRIGEILTQESVRDALRLSLVCSVAATALCVVFGVPLAWVLARVRFPGRAAVRALTTLSMVLPPVVGGVALLAAFGRRGMVGEWLFDWFGFRLPFTTWGVIVAETFVAMPFLVLTVEAALRGADRRYEEAARTLGAGRWMVFRRVTLPMVAPSLAAGTVLAWARALGEFGATITFAGSLQGATRTMPLEVYLALETDRDAAIVLSLVLLLVSFVVLMVMRERWTSGLSAGTA